MEKITEELDLLNEESLFLNLFFLDDENCCASCSNCPAYLACQPCAKPPT